ncbi:hypothetical protein RJ55_04271 [Drechmeria coniospora]|nr:hypothetical protein RJ55_04271 [Drechmeria coniospora]
MITRCFAFGLPTDVDNGLIKRQRSAPLRLGDTMISRRTIKQSQGGDKHDARVVGVVSAHQTLSRRCQSSSCGTDVHGSVESPVMRRRDASWQVLKACTRDVRMAGP